MTSSPSSLVRYSLVFILLTTFHHVLSLSTPSSLTCASQPCLNGGTCLEYKTAFICRCMEGFTGLRCELSDANIVTACANNTCEHGECVSSAADRFNCMCPSEWRGTACEIDVNECLERDEPCTNNTICVNQHGGYSCEDPCTPNPCNNGATCAISDMPDSAANYLCDCPPNFEGDTCDILVETDDACRSLDYNCDNGGTCFSFGGAAICYCLPGFQGEHCEIDTDVCHTIACQNGGYCVKARDQLASCVCPQFYNGTYCEVELSPCMYDPCNTSSICVADLTLASGFLCMSPCVKDPCLNGATCVNNQTAPLGFICACPPDYQGPTCQQAIPPCTREPCLNGGICESDPVSPMGYRCTCEAGFQGATCELTIISVCTFEGITYEDGNMRHEDCNTCHCQKGSWHCTDKFCGEFMVSFAFIQPNDFDDDVEFSNSLKEDIASYFKIDVDMIHVLTVSGNPSEVEFQLRDTHDSNVDIENVAADMLRQFVTGTYAFHHKQASYSINSHTVVIERHEGEVTDNGTEGINRDFVNTTLIIVCVVVSAILVFAIVFGIAMIVVYKRRSRKEKIYSRKDNNTNASNNVPAGGSAITFHKNVYNPVPPVPPRDGPFEVSEIRLQNGRKPVNLHMEARV